MRFRLFGVPVTVRGLFWIMAVLMGLGVARANGVWALPVWVAAIFVSVLVHEMGHAVAFMRHGVRPSVTLHALGGVTSPGEDVGLSRFQSAVISLAGPIAGLLFGGIAYLAARALPPGVPLAVTAAVQFLLWINVTWSLFNLLPVLPFDGGHVMQQILGPRRLRLAAGVSLVLSAVLAALTAWQGESFLPFLFVMSAIQSYQLYTAPPGAVLVNPFTAPAGTSAGGPSPLRRWWLERKLSRLRAEADALHGDEERPRAREEGRRRAGGPDLRVIQGGADRRKDKRYLN